MKLKREEEEDLSLEEDLSINIATRLALVYSYY